MTRKKGAVLVLLLTLILTSTSCTSIDTDNFNEDIAYNHIKELSSEKYEGRLMGTEGNERAADYIASQFEEIGLEPVNNGSYFQTFTAISPILNDP